ncbi:MAG: hypothetical protein Q7S33_04775 [Nanoarchaeota archaeon]|nr:hypothetical protein [Nanoarchaeota archaeon]
MVNETDFQRARREPDFREKFIDRISLGDAEKYTMWNYINKDFSVSEFGIKGWPVMATLDAKEISGPFKPSNIQLVLCVFPKAFDYSCENLNDFLSTFLDHELNHIKRRYINGFPKDKISLCQDEIETYESQIKKNRFKRCSRQYKEGVYFNYLHYLDEYSKMKSKTD